MKILKINNNYSCEEQPSIVSTTLRMWLLNDKLHRGGGKPAVETEYTKLFFWRGLAITEKIAEAKLSIQEILEIENMEIRQAAMEIIGYEKFFQYAKEIHRFTPEQFEKKFPVKSNPMYSLYLLQTGKDEKNDDIKILMMNDPSKFPFVKYFIRVHPDEIDCGLAVAHSYDYKTYDEFNSKKFWV